MPKHNFSYTFNGLFSLILKLTSPTGCEWDKTQTIKSLRTYLLEETYEIIDAINDQNYKNLLEEVGDLLFLIIFQIKLIEDKKLFKKEDVFKGIIDKLVNRHPEIFSSSKKYINESPESKWETIKKEEKINSQNKSLLAGIPQSLPSLTLAQLIQKRASFANFDWKKFEDILPKINEELTEIKESANPEEQEIEFGDLLFTLVNIARWIGIDSEIALRKSNHKFIKRFEIMEKLSNKENKNFRNLNKNEQELLWEKSKKFI